MKLKDSRYLILMLCMALEQSGPRSTDEWNKEGVQKQAHTHTHGQEIFGTGTKAIQRRKDSSFNKLC